MEGKTIDELKEQLRSKFEDFGTIKSMILKIDNNLKKPFGFICYETHESASQAIDKMHDTDPFGIYQKFYS